jgi:PAS domain S-box-containing protein
VDLDARVRTFLGRLGEAAPVGLAAIDRDLRYIAVNERLAEMNGVSTGGHVGRTMRDLVPSIAAQTVDLVERVFADGAPIFGVEVQARHRLTGALRWAEASCFPIAEDGHVVAVGIAVLDTTDRIKALRRLLLLQDAVSAISAAPEPLTAVHEIAERALAAVGAQGAAAALASTGSRWLEVVAVAGPLGRKLLEAFPRIPLDVHAPATVSYHQAEMVWVPKRDQWERDYPEGSNLVGLGASAALSVPLRLARSGECLGVLGLLWDHEPDISNNDLTLVATFAQQATEALDRIMLLDSERRGREQFELLARLGDRVDEEMGIAARVNAFADIAVPEFVDFCLVEVSPEVEGDNPTVFVRHVDPEREPLLRRFRELRRDTATPATLTGVIETGLPTFLGATLIPEPSAVDKETLRVAAELGIASSALLPLVARGHVFGGVALGRSPGRVPLTDEDFALATELVRRLAVALENARLYERERQIAETLQHSLLPDRVPDIPGIRCWPRYLPGTDLVVGGDFWDVLPLPAGRALLVVGDVAGRGEGAAITMGRLRTVLRASVRQERSPATLMAALNRFLVEDEREMATCVCAALDPAEQTLRVASAGHLPLLRVGADGTAALIGGATGLPLGVRAFSTYEEDVFEVVPGDTLVLFTDGLVERRDIGIDDRLEQLVGVAVDAIATGGETWCDRVVDAMIGARRSDDVAVLGVRLASGPQTFFTRVPAELGRLRALRDRLRAWLAANRVDHDSVEALCLAVGEATANVAIHAYGPSGGELRVSGTLDDGVVRVRIEDDGHWRPPPDDLGRGMRIIEQLADESRIERRADGTTVELVRHSTPS